jgi:rare lipoprotein A (peptidoglycan hydrolase)
MNRKVFFAVFFSLISVINVVHAQVIISQQRGGASYSSEILGPEFTAAHSSLPIGSIATVVNTRNAIQVDVRITHRILPSATKIIELSYAAAEALGIIGAGTVEVIVYPRSVVDTRSDNPSPAIVTNDRQEGPTSQNRYALVIGNANYYDPNINTLPNAINDTNDITAALRNLGFETVLRQNLTQREMAREIEIFTARLKGNRNSEGFFWYAGHAMEINGENLLLPTDVDRDSESLVKISSYSATNLARELESIPNKLNLMVLDACRTPPSIGGERGRGAGDVTRLVKTIQVATADLLIIYSTASGAEALDGRGNNSPFTESFLKHIYSTEPLIYTLAEIIDDTKSLTNLRQTPYYNGNLGRENVRYSLNSVGVQPGSLR